MAKYVYKCPDCGIEKDVEHPMSACDTHTELCPNCVEKEVEMRRKPTSFRFRMVVMG